MRWGVKTGLFRKPSSFAMRLKERLCKRTRTTLTFRSGYVDDVQAVNVNVLVSSIRLIRDFDRGRITECPTHWSQCFILYKLGVPLKVGLCGILSIPVLEEKTVWGRSCRRWLLSRLTASCHLSVLDALSQWCSVSMMLCLIKGICTSYRSKPLETKVFLFILSICRAIGC